MIPLAYLAAILLAETLTLLAGIAAGAACHTFVMIALLAHASWYAAPHGRPLFLSLALLPLARVISLSLPPAPFPAWSRPLLLSLPLAAAVTQVTVQTNCSWLALLAPGRRIRPQLLFGLTGFAIGSMQYSAAHRPLPLPTPPGTQIWLALPGLLLLGGLQELIFRRLLQDAAVSRLGLHRGVLYTAVLYAALHLGFQSIPAVFLALLTGLLYGWQAARTGSILGSSISAALAAVTLHLLIPVWYSGALDQTTAFLHENIWWMLLLLCGAGVSRLLYLNPNEPSPHPAAK